MPVSVFGANPASGDAVRLAEVERQLAQLQAALNAATADLSELVGVEAGSRATGDAAAAAGDQAQQDARIQGDQALSDLIAQVDLARELGDRAIPAQVARAEEAIVGANAARDAAQAQADAIGDISAAVTSTTENRQATEAAAAIVLPLKPAVDKVERKTESVNLWPVPGWASLITDRTGRIVSGVRTNGLSSVSMQTAAEIVQPLKPSIETVSRKTAAVERKTEGMNIWPVPGWKTLVADRTGRIISGIRDNGTSAIAAAALANGATLFVAAPTRLPARVIAGGVEDTTAAYHSIVTDRTGRIIRGEARDGVTQISKLRVIENDGPQESSSGDPVEAPTIALPGFGALQDLTVDRFNRPVHGHTHAGRSLSINRAGSLDFTAYAGFGKAERWTSKNVGSAPFHRALVGDNILNLYIVTGQSLAVGGSADRTAQPINTTALYPDYVWTFKTPNGPRVMPLNRDIIGFDGLREVNSSADQEADENGAGGPVESVCSGFANTLHQLIFDATGARHRIAIGIAAKGGAIYRGLQRGTSWYAEGLRLIEEAVRHATPLGLRVVVRGIIIVHGESDQPTASREDYAHSLNMWRWHYDADARAITGQTEPVRALISQTNRGNGFALDPRTPTAVLDAMDADPLTTCAGPIYNVLSDYVPGVAGTGSHPSSAGFMQMGEQFAHVEFAEGHFTGFRPLRIKEKYVRWLSATQLYLPYTGAITIATAENDYINTFGLGVGGRNPFGFENADALNSPVDSPRIVAADVIESDVLRLTFSKAPVATMHLGYATAATGGNGGDIGMGRVGGARGLIRAPTPFATSQNGELLYHRACAQYFNLPTAPAA